MTNKKPVKWLPLDVDALDDIKIMALVMALGMEGYGIYIMLIQFLAKQEPSYSSSVDAIKYLAYKNHISEEKVKAVVSGFNLFVHDGDVFYSASLIGRMEGYDKVRAINTIKANKRWEKQRALCSSNAAALPMQSHKRREEKSRIDNSRKEKNTDSNTLADLSFCNESFLTAWEKWLKFKDELKDPYKTTTGMQTQYAHLVKISGNDPDVALKIVEKSIRKEWKGLFPLDDSENITPGEDPVQKIMNDIKKARAL